MFLHLGCAQTRAIHTAAATAGAVPASCTVGTLKPTLAVKDRGAAKGKGAQPVTGGDAGMCRGCVLLCCRVPCGRFALHYFLLVTLHCTVIPLGPADQEHSQGLPWDWTDK
jgi:hypothetical protein